MTNLERVITQLSSVAPLCLFHSLFWLTSCVTWLTMLSLYQICVFLWSQSWYSEFCHRVEFAIEKPKLLNWQRKHLSLKKLCWSWNKHLAVNSVCSSHGNLQFQLSLTVLVWRGGVWEKGNCDFNKFPHLWDNKRILFFISAYEWRNSSDGDLQSWHENTSSTQLPLPQKTLLLHSLKRLVWSRDFTSVT